MQTAGVPMHVSDPLQVVGQVAKLPHPSLTLPQMGAPVDVVQTGLGTHAGWPHTDGVPPPPQVSVPLHAGRQVYVPPHPSG